MTGGLALALLLASAPLARHEAARVSMGSTFALELRGPDPDALRGAAEAALDEVDRIDRLLSHYRPDSALSRINRAAGRGPVAAGPELIGFLARCQQMARDSGGAFDITVGPLLKTWGFFDDEPHLPSAPARARALAAVGYRHLQIDEPAGTVRFSRPGMSLDPGGVGKGYAVDRAVAVLRRHGVTSALLSAGGSTIFALGHPPDREAWPVTVRLGEQFEKIFHLRDRALSVSGPGQRSFRAGGQRHGHVFDPRSGRPIRGITGVVVMGPTGTDTDALDQVVAVLGSAAFRALPPAYRATIVFEDGRIASQD